MKVNKENLKKGVRIYALITLCVGLATFKQCGLSGAIYGLVLFGLGFSMGAVADRLECIEEQEDK